MRRWEVDLNAAKGKVGECEKALSDLRKEVEEADRNIGTIESGLVELEQRILGSKNHELEASTSESANSSSGSVNFSRHQQLNTHGHSSRFVSRHS
jgi:chromosome segregation ATPase